MKSKIINMAERMKDEEDRRLESLFAAEPIADDGFSVAVVGKIQRRQWVRRLSLPVAILAGGVMAAKPLFALIVSLPAALENLAGLALPFAPDAPLVLTAATLVMVLVLVSRILEE